MGYKSRSQQKKIIRLLLEKFNFKKVKLLSRARVCVRARALNSRQNHLLQSIHAYLAKICGRLDHNSLPSVRNLNFPMLWVYILNAVMQRPLWTLNPLHIVPILTFLRCLARFDADI